MNTQCIVRKGVPVVVKAHSGEGQYIDGIYVPAEKISYEKRMAVVPITVDELKYFDDENFEENFTVEDRKFYDAAMDVSIEENDIIEYREREFEIAKVLDRTEHGFKIYYGKVQK